MDTPLEPTIVFEDSDFLVIDKPSGLITHPKNSNDTQLSVLSWFHEHYPETLSIHDSHPDLPKTNTIRTGLVHRLDRETSGLLILPKTQSTFDYFKDQFQRHLIHKTYIALVYGIVSAPDGVITAPLGKFGIKQTTTFHGKHDLVTKEATTRYHLLKTYREYTLLELKPETGRTHQLRIHLKSIGHPIVCDILYAKKQLCPANLGRLFLHAQKLEFRSPSGQAFALETELPQVLQNFLATLR